MDLNALAEKLLTGTRYVVLGTADADGRPWTSPVWFARAADGAFIWVSDPEARHSRNIAVRPYISLVVFDSTVPPGAGRAFYAEASAAQTAEPEDLECFSRASVRDGMDEWGPFDVSGDTPRRLYKAAPTRTWVVDRDDRRIEVPI